ncbi:MAG: transposase, partial [Blastocatellia bacterium]
MYLEPLSDLSWAYRLHYDLAFQTHWRRPHFADQPAAEHLTTLLSEICSHHGYHNLEVKAYPDHARLLISLRPTEVLQPEHHGYARRVLPPVHRFRADERNPLKTAHASFELSHHIVFSTEYRNGVFTSEAGAALARYWLRVAEKHGFAIDQMSFLPDHVHLLVRT